MVLEKNTNFLSLLARKEANINIQPKEIKTGILTQSKNPGSQNKENLGALFL